MRLKSRMTLFVALLLTLGLWGCTNLEQPVPANLEPTLSAHPEAFSNPESPTFHGNLIRENNWDLTICQNCHGEDYTGGIAESSCLTCHPDTPEDCIVCHGKTDNLTGAPPHDLDGNVDVSFRGVGAHTRHLEGGDSSVGFACETCHLVPAEYAAPGHVDSDLPAELTFAGAALLDGATPQWSTNSLSCSDSYCHGNWSLAKSESNFQAFYTADEIEGNNASPVWTDPATADCGSCHGLPPTGHMPATLTSCVTCHGEVVDQDGAIIDATKHVNGMVNVFRQEYPIF